MACWSVEGFICIFCLVPPPVPSRPPPLCLSVAQWSSEDKVLKGLQALHSSRGGCSKIRHSTQLVEMQLRLLSDVWRAFWGRDGGEKKEKSFNPALLCKRNKSPVNCGYRRCWSCHQDPTPHKRLWNLFLICFEIKTLLSPFVVAWHVFRYSTDIFPPRHPNKAQICWLIAV